jgi:CubicO group peptidase (beta-lactamase class C family)
MSAETIVHAARRDSASPSLRRHGTACRHGATTALAAALLAFAPAVALGQTPGGPGAPPPPPPETQPAPPPAVTPPPPPPVDESVLVDAPPAPPDRGAPRATLAAARADLLALVRSRPDAAVDRAARAVDRAQRAFGDTPRGLRPTHLAATTTALRSAQRALQSVKASGLRQRRLAVIARRLDRVARRIGRELVARLARSGAAPRVISRARAQLALGDRLAGAGRHTAAAGAYGKSVKTSGNAIVFDAARFEQNIRGFFDTQTTGYSYAIVRNKVLFSEKGVGFARTKADTVGGSPHGPHREVNIASVTKTITAAAVLKLMEKNKLDLDESIEPFLPKQWEVHPSIEDLTFKDLMTQRSGLGGNQVGQSTSLATLQAAMALGVKPADKTYVYQNANLGIFRVIIPGLLGVDLYGDPNTPPDVLAAKTYVNYLKTQVFDQNDALPDCKPNEDLFGFATRAYAFPDDGKAGVDMGDWSLGCGGGGLHLSAHELARFLVRLRFTNEILSPLWRQRMNEDFLGYMDPASSPSYSWNNGAFGVYRSHGGDLNYGARGVDTCAINFSITVQAVVLINSRGGNYPYQCAALAQAFDAAWVAK